MIAEILTGLIKANLAAGAAVLVVLAVRRPVRPRFGAGAAYRLWLAPLAAGLAVLAPHPAVQMVTAPLVIGATAAVDAFVAAAPARLGAGPDLPGALFGLWLAGAAGAGLLLLRRQRAFLAAMGRLEPFGAGGVFRAEHDVGPAVVGVLRPRIVAPADFEARFAAPERALILAHERAHLRRGDALANALACAAQCLCWFNPLVHLAARLARIDQELACDATVIGAFPGERRTYAELLLKTQLATQPLPLGCHWPAGAEHPLKARIAMLKSPLPGRDMRALGLVVAGALSLGAASLAWAAQPGGLEPEQARKLAGPNGYSLCKPDANHELHNCTVHHGTPWAQIATAADVAREYPPQALRAGLTADVLLKCRPDYASKRLADCAAAKIYGPPGKALPGPLDEAFGRAALKVAAVYRLGPTPAGEAPEPNPMFMVIQFKKNPAMPGGPAVGPAPTHAPPDLPVPAEPQAARARVNTTPVSFASPVIVKPDWVVKPVGADIADVYPPEALKAGLGGAATIGCAVSLEGRLEHCKVLDEAPAQAGFGEAALKLADRFQMKPMTRDGVPVPGGTIRIPIHFALPHAPQPVTPS